MESKDQREIYGIKNFPYTKKQKSSKRYRVILGIGGNIGDVKMRFQRLFYILNRHRDIDILKTAPIYKNPPFGYQDQNYFLNSAIKLATNFSYLEFFSYIMYIEKRLGRIRTFKNAPRKIDLDIIFFDKIRLKRDWLEIPHPMWSKRDSVLIPIFYLKE